MRKSVVSMLVVLLPAIARAQPAVDDSAYEPTGRWQGTSWGFELRTGASFRAQDTSITPAPFVGAGVRVCTLLTLIDAELYVTTAGLSRTTKGGDYDLRRTSIGLDLRLHPMFMRHLQGSFGDRLMAGIHLAFGAGADVLSTAGGAGGAARDRTDVGFAFGVGLGVDVPLTEPERATYSLWLGLGWRMRFVGFDGGAPGLRDMDEHLAVVSLGIRFHDLTGFRIAPPPELDDVDR